jgi:hypothetical protein
MALVAIYIWRRHYKNSTDIRNRAVAALKCFFMAHAILFQIGVIFEVLPPLDLNLWSNGLRIHGIGCILLAGVFWGNGKIKKPRSGG